MLVSLFLLHLHRVGPSRPFRSGMIIVAIDMTNQVPVGGQQRWP